MKKFLSVLALALLLLAGCGDRTSFDDVYLISAMAIPSGDSGSRVIPVKFNVVTGSVTPLCADPLCDHGRGSGCIFADYMNGGLTAFRNGYFYYETWDFLKPEDPRRLCRYDVESGRVRVIWEIPGGGCSAYTGSGMMYIRYYDPETVWQIDLENGKVTELAADFEFPIREASIVSLDGYEYYMKEAENPPCLGYDANYGEDVYNTTGGILWRRDPASGEETAVVNNPAYDLRMADIHAVSEYIVVGYRNYDYSTPADDGVVSTGGGVVYPEEKGWLVYSTVTGEAHYHKAEMTAQ